MDYAIGPMGIDPDEFSLLFATSGDAHRIEIGDRSVILGRSGAELAQQILRERIGRTDFPEARTSVSRSPFYWTGWILADYQWRSNRSFREIQEAIPASVVRQMYPTGHEAPEERFAEVADRLMAERFPDTRLKRVRTAFGCSQSVLAEKAGVGLRSIQMYEQRRKDINRASGETLRNLSRTLGCTIEDLLEP